MPTKQRSYSTTEVSQRLGIATQTVQRWVDSGQLKAWKTLGGHRRIEAKGAELLFRLHGVALPDEAQATDAASEPDGVSALSVLVVDDNPDDREILANLVEANLPSAQVAAAANGFHGLIAIGRMAPDVVITDLMMPHMNGFEMLRHLMSGAAVKPRFVLAVSSNALQELTPRGELPAGVAFMRKPLDPELFAEKWREGLHLHK